MGNVRFAPARPLGLTQATWWYLAAVILFVFPVTLAIAFDRQIYHWYIRTFVVPKLERELGFSSGDIPAAFPRSRPYRMFGITSVRPGGAFAAAGFRAGDIPVGYVDAGFMEGFVADIRKSLETAQPVEFSVINAGERDRSGEFVRREVAFRPPAKPLQK